MLNTSESTTTITAPLAPAPEFTPCGPGKPADTPTIICDLADSDAFVESYRKPHVPVMSSFGAGRLHVFRLFGSWDMEKAVSENHNRLFRSVRKMSSKQTKEEIEMLDCPAAKRRKKEWDDLTFQFGPRSFVYMDKDRIIGFATTPDEAANLAINFGDACKSSTSSDAGGEYHLIQVEPSEIRCHTVPLPSGTVLDEQALNLHYGTGSAAWHENFVKQLRAKDRGLSIFEGVPGTGKTFYIRHLMGALRESHRFYFIPTANLNVLSRADCIGFWAEQRRQYADRQFVVVLEDSDAALMTRASDNREDVSAILNLTDGLLADFLRLHIVCTINCTASDIDPALMRPGRLLCHRIFSRLNYAEALRLAKSLGRNLPVAIDYSLAEIFADSETQEVKRRHIGFAG